MSEPSDVSHVAEATLERFVRQVFSALGASEETAHLAARSLLDASLAGVDSHGVEALDMYVAHLRAGGLDARAELALLRERGGLSLWDMRSGFGLAGARRLMAHVMGRAGDFGVAMAIDKNIAWNVVGKKSIMKTQSLSPSLCLLSC